MCNNSLWKWPFPVQIQARSNLDAKLRAITIRFTRRLFKRRWRNVSKRVLCATWHRGAFSMWMHHRILESFVAFKISTKNAPSLALAVQNDFISSWRRLLKLINAKSPLDCTKLVRSRFHVSRNRTNHFPSREEKDKEL